MNKKIIVIGNAPLFEKIQRYYKELKINAEIEYFQMITEVILEEGQFIVDEINLQDAKQQEFLFEKVDPANIVVICHQMDSIIAKQAIQRGTQIHFVEGGIYALINKLQGITSIKVSNNYKEEHIAQKNHKVLQITSPVGGCGKSTLALVTAEILAQKGKKVLLIDFSNNSDLAARLQIKHEAGLNGLIAKMLKEESFQIERDRNLLENNCIHYESYKAHIDLLYGITPIVLEKTNSHIIDRLILILKSMDYDLIIFDTGSEMSELNLAISDCADLIFVLSLPNISSGWKLIQHKEMMELIQATKKCRLIINKYTKKANFSSKQLETELQYPWIGVIPYDKEMAEGARQGKAVLIQNNRSVNYYHFIANTLFQVFDKKELHIEKIKK